MIEVLKAKESKASSPAEKILAVAGSGLLLNEVIEDKRLTVALEDIKKIREAAERTFDSLANDTARIRQLQERQIDRGEIEHMNLTIVNRWDKHHFTQSYKSIFIRNKGPAVITLKIELDKMLDPALEKFISTNSPEIEVDTTDIIDIKFNEERVTGLQCRTASGMAVLKVTLAR